MNARIISMNHSPRMQERDSEPLPRERDLSALYSELVARAGAVDAGQFGQSLTGMPYADKCAECLRVLAYMDALDADQPADARTAMTLRSNVISAALKDGDGWMGQDQSEELWKELDEIQAWLQKDDQPELGSRVTIRCGEVVEHDRPATTAADEVFQF